MRLERGALQLMMKPAQAVMKPAQAVMMIAQLTMKTTHQERQVMKMDDFFIKKYCDRCKNHLRNGRTMSAFNTQCICMECKEKERFDPEYKKAVDAEHEEIKKGNYNFKGIRGK